MQVKEAIVWAWYAKIDSFLLSLNFVRCKSDPNVYLKLIHGSLMIIFLYVNDLLITGSSKDEIASLKDAISFFELPVIRMSSTYNTIIIKEP